tara:strand:+ start:43 stop:573 length:531 start_codon:yes stop_codon:yes gene_type:complete
MKKLLIISVLFVVPIALVGCQPKTVYTGQPGSDAAGKTISKSQFLALPDLMIEGLEDKTDYVGPVKQDPLDTADEVITALSPVGALFPMGGAILGIAGTMVRMGRKYRPIVEQGKTDAEALYELVRGIQRAGNGEGIEGVTGKGLATELRSSMSDTSKGKIDALLNRLEHEEVDGT